MYVINVVLQGSKQSIIADQGSPMTSNQFRDQQRRMRQSPGDTEVYGTGASRLRGSSSLVHDI